MSSAIAKLEFENNAGETLDFLVSWINVRELRGFEGGGISHRRVESPLQDGSSYLNSRKLDMMPMIMFEAEGLTWAQMNARRRQIISVLRPNSGEGVLRFQPHAASDEYELVALVDPQPLSAPRRDSYSQIEIWTVRFRAGDPFWNVVPFNEDGLEPGGYQTIDNVGDDASYPTIEINPTAATGRNPFVRNVTTGFEFGLEELSVLSTEELVIDMQRKTVKLDGVAVAENLLSTASQFWSLARGENVIVGSPGAPIVGTGANDGGAGTAWGNPERITNETNGASVSLSSGSSQLLLATNLGLSVDSGATITGVRAIIHARQTLTSVRHAVVQLWNGSSLIGDNQGGTGSGSLFHVSTTAGDYRSKTFGGYDDLLGATLTPAIVNSSGFGLALRMQNLSGTTLTDVRSVYVEVFWTETSGTPGSQVVVVHPTKLDGV